MNHSLVLNMSHVVIDRSVRRLISYPRSQTQQYTIARGLFIIRDLSVETEEARIRGIAAFYECKAVVVGEASGQR